MRIRYSEWDGTQLGGPGYGVVVGDPREDWDPMMMFLPSGGAANPGQSSISQILRHRVRARSSGMFGSTTALMRQARAVRSRKLNLEGSLEDIDEDALRKTLGDRVLVDLRALMRVEAAGLVNTRKGRLEITARGARKLGDKALAQIFRQLQWDREGTRESREIGGLAEPTGATRPWQFGDSGQFAVQRTVFNAVLRGGPGHEVRLTPDDFELLEAEHRTQAATALLVDLSSSMAMRGHFGDAMKMALALHALIAGHHPNDRLYIIGFSNYARQIKVQDLPMLVPDNSGTNMHHAFHLAGRLLAKHPRCTRQVIMVTDGEPTAHLDGEELVYALGSTVGDTFHESPGRMGRAGGGDWVNPADTVRVTLTEAMRLSRTGVTINVFMLERSPGLIKFMERLARLTAGRVFLVKDADLGAFVLRDYVTRRDRMARRAS
ncbi:MAG: VWA domain-containing protein [Actinomycetota bacterium]